MNHEALLRKIKRKAKQDQKKRCDPRFLQTMGFLVAKGFLRTNLDIPLLPNKRIQVEDAIWAGKNVEPRILEVLPAAVLRLTKHFGLDPEQHPELNQVVEQLRRRDSNGTAFCEIPYEKLKQWAELPLRDKRTKTVTAKKVLKAFRLTPTVVDRLKAIARARGCSETDVVEELVSSGPPKLSPPSKK